MLFFYFLEEISVCLFCFQAACNVAAVLGFNGNTVPSAVCLCPCIFCTTAVIFGYCEGKHTLLFPEKAILMQGYLGIRFFSIIISNPNGISGAFGSCKICGDKGSFTADALFPIQGDDFFLPAAVFHKRKTGQIHAKKGNEKKRRQSKGQKNRFLLHEMILSLCFRFYGFTNYK
jgi:hypothetical protein